MSRPGLTCLLLTGALALSTPLAADPVDDARSIITVTLTDESMSGVIAAMGPMISSAMENDFRNNGIVLSDPDTFIDILTEEFMDGYLKAMRAEMVTVYVEEFTADELAGIAAFFASPAGQAMAARSGVLAQRGAEIGRTVGQKAALAVADRIAARLRAEGVTITSDPSMQKKLLDRLDQMGGGN